MPLSSAPLIIVGEADPAPDEMFALACEATRQAADLNQMAAALLLRIERRSFAEAADLAREIGGNGFRLASTGLALYGKLDAEQALRAACRREADSP